LVAIRAADQIIMPVRPSFLDVAALRDTVRLLEMAEKVDAAVAVLNAVPSRGSLADEAEEALGAFKVRVAPERIGQRNPLANAIPQGKGVTEFAPKDAAAAEIKALWKRLRDAPKPKTTTKTMSKRK
jgi:chromosome partitioning protein